MYPKAICSPGPPLGDMNNKQIGWGGQGLVMVNATRKSSAMFPKAMYSGSRPLKRHEHKQMGWGIMGADGYGLKGCVKNEHESGSRMCTCWYCHRSEPKCCPMLGR